MVHYPTTPAFGENDDQASSVGKCAPFSYTHFKKILNADRIWTEEGNKINCLKCEAWDKRPGVWPENCGCKNKMQETWDWTAQLCRI